MHMVPTTANRQAAAVAYMRPHGEPASWLNHPERLRIEHGEIAEISTLATPLPHRFDLPLTLYGFDARRTWKSSARGARRAAGGAKPEARYEPKTISPA
jgi:hypothetical protein